jgi:apolipoprotein N-acyltransferase
LASKEVWARIVFFRTLPKKDFNSDHFKPSVESDLRTQIGIALGIIIFLADIYWLYYDQSYTVPVWEYMGIIIAIATIIWIAIDASFLRQGGKPKMTGTGAPSTST